MATFTIDQYIKQIQKTKRELLNEVAVVLTEIAQNDAAAVIVNRLLTRGIHGDGGKDFYSQNPTLIGRQSFTSQSAANKVLGSKNKRKQLSWVNVKGNSLAVLEGGYKEIRNIEGREVNFKNYERTGEMWKQFGVISVKKGKGEVTATLGGKNKDSQDRINWNSARYGESIIDLTEKEEQQIEQALDKWFGDFLSKRL